MKPTEETLSSFSSSNESVSFGIREEDMSFVMTTLRKGLYTDKVLAVLREYGSNAWDAHRMVGTPDRPIVVNVPTRENPVLTIRDFGPGLSHEDVFNIYANYGASTKRNSNAAVGMLGLGSKSGFAYSDMFTVTSWHDGHKRIYVCVIDESKKGKIELLADEASDQENGVEIMIVARQEDVWDFQNKAKNLYQHFDPRPLINIELPPVPADRTVLKNGSITGKTYYGSEWIAIMGCVPYRVNLQQLPEGQIAKCLSHLSGSLFFGIGDVQIAHSREELEYGTATKNKIVGKLNALVDEYVVQALEDLDRPEVSGWDKRLKVRVLKAMELPLPDDYQEWADANVKLTYAPGTIVVLHNESVCTTLGVGEATRLLIDDTGKSLKGYFLRASDYVVRAAPGFVGDVRATLDDAVTASGLGGIKIELLSALSWSAPYVKPKKVVNPKHKAKMFALKADGSLSTPYSECWEMVSRVAEDTDVFVLISGFQAIDYSNFYLEVKDDRRLARELGVDMPVVYGYKSTPRAPAAVTNGVGYKVWRATWLQSLLTPARIQQIQDYYWANPSGYFQWPSDKNRAFVEANLGVNHPICQLFQRRAKPEVPGIARLATRSGISSDGSDAGKAIATICQHYPLLESGNWGVLWGVHCNRPKHWFEYIKLIDARDAALPVDNAGTMLMVDP